MHRLHHRAATVAAAICLTFAASAGTVAAAAETGQRAVTVSLGGLDLASSSGLNTARHRIMIAARRACDQPYGADIQATMDYDRCQQDAVSDAMPALAARVAAVRAKAQFASR